MKLPTPAHMGWTPPSWAPAAAADAARGALCGLLLLGSTAVVTVPDSALAAPYKTDGAAIGKCLLKSCQKPLARCVTDPTCAANLVCIQTCAANPETEAECQIKCGDEFSNDVVADFTKCAVSDKSCVPQRPDDGSWPVPKNEALATTFKPENFVGNWYISAGLNKAFDTFDCQLHKFESPADNKLVGNLQWRIKDPIAGTNFVTRYTVQEFVQDPKVPGILYNHDNEFLHYQDDWYILAEKQDAYAVIYYRGSNDAWDGYGGATVYSRDPKLPRKYYPEINEALQKVGYTLDDFTLTDNSCKAAETRLEEVEADLVLVETRVASGVATTGKAAFKEITKDIMLVEKEIEKDIVKVEMEVVKDEKAVEDLFSNIFSKK